MYFNSLAFLLFMSLLFIIYWKVDERYRWGLLLGSSYFFYFCWGVVYLLILIVLTLVSYIAGILIYRNRERKQGKVFTIAMVVSMVFLLCGYKYSVFSAEPFVLKIVMPIGMSFYTFKIISYLVDIYRGEAPEYHLGRYAIFVAFFPEISSGPIDRGNKLLTQLEKVHTFNYDKITYGLKLVAWGYFKKVIIADALAGYVNQVWRSLYSYSGAVLLLVSFFFTIQIYCDFSGYSDMAVGIARLLDIDIMVNFRSPYYAVSIKEFWRRWHISLSSWLRDYVYIPLGGGRSGKGRWILNIMLTFLVSGIWHGSGFNYIAWGMLHGIAQIAESYCCNETVRGWKRIVRTGIVFLFCTFAWIFFRAESLEQVKYILERSFCGITHPFLYLRQGQVDLQFDLYMCARMFFLLVVLAVFDYINQSKDVIEMISQQKKWIRWMIYVLFTFLILVFLPVRQTQEFVYFQF